MRVYVAAHGSELGGAELSLREVVKAFIREGHTVLVTMPTPEGAVHELEFLNGARVVPVPTRRWMGQRQTGPAGVFRLTQAIWDARAHLRMQREWTPDVVLVNTGVVPAPLMAAALLGLPRVLMLRETLMTNPTLRSAAPKRLIRWLLSRLSTLVIANSNFSAEQFRHPACVIPPQVSSRFTRKAVPHRKPGSGPTRFTMIGTISEEKGQISAVEAVGIARSGGANVRLEIYGPGPARDIARLKALIRDLGLEDAVEYRGPSSAPERVLSEADGSLVCSRNEAFGKVTVESLLSGTPVIGYSLGGTAEILAEGGGILVRPTPDAMASAIMEFAESDSLRERLAASAVVNPVALTTLDSSRQIVELVIAHARSRLTEHSE